MHLLRTLCLTLLAAAIVAAQPGESILANGTFDALNGDGPAGWSGHQPQRSSVPQEGGNRFLRFVLTEPSNIIVQQSFAVDARWTSVRISGRLRARGVGKGAENWHSGMIQYVFNDASGNHVGGWPKFLIDADQDWRTYTDEVLIPAGAAQLQIQCAALSCTGTFDFDDIQVVPNFGGQLPAGIVEAGNEPVEVLSPTRSRIVLNGVWRFQPAVGPAEGQAVDTAWGFIRVPGTWTPRGKYPGIVAAGLGAPWSNLDPKTLGKGWYERDLAIPADWAGRAVQLELARVSTDAIVSLDGVECGRVSWPYGEVDLTRQVKPGTTQRLRVLVAAVQNQDTVLNAMGVGQNTAVKADLPNRGLIGEVFLHSRPANGRIADCAVTTSVRRKRLELALELAGVTGPGPATVEVVAMRQNREAKRFRAEVALTTAGDQTLSVGWDWLDPVLWDVGRPELYTLLTRVTAPGVDDTMSQVIGFRELWIDGRRILLNGSDFRMRPTSSFPEGQYSSIDGSVEGIDLALQSLLDAGFNTLELWPWNHDQRGTMHFRELVCERADRLGIAVLGPALSAGEVIMVWRSPNWTEPGVKEDWEQRMRRELRRYRNHASIVMWATTANCFGHIDDQNPLAMGRPIDDPVWAKLGAEWRAHMLRGQEVVDAIKRADPTRPVLVHQGGPVGDVYALNNYLCLIPLQEREEWLSAWARDAQMPYMAVEFGTPLHVTFNRGRNGFGNAQASEPLMTEFSAMYLGTDAYRSESPGYRKAISDKFLGKQAYSGWHGNSLLEGAAAFQEIQRLFVTATWRSWRTMGVTGGLIPWSNAHGFESTGEKQAAAPWKPGQRGAYFAELPLSSVMPFSPRSHRVLPGGEALLAVNGETLAWICHRPSEIDSTAFLAKDHSFRAGATVQKAIALLNDSRSTQPYRCSWSIQVAGAEIAKGTCAGDLAIGATRFEAITATLPATIAGAKVDGTIILDATIGSQKHSDRFAFRIFAPESAAPMPRVAVVDPDGSTTRLLTGLGIAAAPWSGGTAELLVIGRDALVRDPSLTERLDRFVQDGGRAIVMGQQPSWYARMLGLRMCPWPSRRVFPVSADHPVVSGLDRDDLRDWTGISTLAASQPDMSQQRTEEHIEHGWRWGNRGSVSSSAFEKPHCAGWRPILECEFDLAWTPLMELDHGRGRLLLSTLDLEDQALRDPAAERLARQLFAYAAAAPIPARSQRIVYLGDDAGAALLTRIGASHVRGGNVLPQDLLIVSGADQLAEALDHGRSGGRSLVLAIRGQGASGITTREVAECPGSVDIPPWPEVRGLSSSDLRFRAAAPATTLTGGAELGAAGLLGRITSGSGVVVFCQLDPDRLDADTKTYLRFTRWRQHRVISQLIANLGGTLLMDDRIFRPRDPESSIIRLDAQQWQAKMIQSLPSAKQPGQLSDPGLTPEAKAAMAIDASTDGWSPLPLPGLWQSFVDAEGEAVFRATVTIPPQLAGKELALCYGSADDFDIAAVNGVEVGRTDKTTPAWWSAPRRYRIPAELTRNGSATIAIRVYDTFGGGGIGGKPRQFVIELWQPPTELGFYHQDYRADFELGDDPFRYFRW